MNKIAFDNEKYIKMQSAKIMERVNRFDNKLYLEFGGKLFDDYHASRVLPGFQPDIKVRMLTSMADKVEIVIVINAHDIEKSKLRSDLGITYNQDVLRLIDAFTGIGLYVSSVVIAQYVSMAPVDNFKSQLEKMGIRVYLHYAIKDYPSNVDFIVSEEGYGRNEYVETTRPLVVVTAPGPGSGKMATCLSQLYHEHKRGVFAGYAKYETFPIFNLPLSHPVNLAYEAATVDLDDVNMIDPFHLEAYGITAVNYNRDVEIFPVLRRILKQITNDDIYHSPTDMGVNMCGLCIVDDDVAREAGKEEIIRRYFQALVDVRMGVANENIIQKMEVIMNKAGLTAEDRKCVIAANEKADQTKGPAVAIELNDGRIVTGKNSALLGAASAALINAMKAEAGFSDETMLLSPNIIEPVQRLKVDFLGNNNPRLHLSEVLVALTISAQMNPVAGKAIEALPKLNGAQAHSTVILSQDDINTFRKLGVMLTCEPTYQTKKLFHPAK
ncbi:MAG: DUF1846 domain-containing protein [Erysipelotrichaceae bacterium]|nr:DUF1846 domain-containing protein [Erysipelotrichaceae bacterium]MBR6958489.1 DUF1846 domain-containing protein [Erysipelotrichaceae bacterium]